MAGIEIETKRKPPEYRSTPMSKLVFDEPLLVSDEFAERFSPSRPKEQGGQLDKRDTPLGQTMVEAVPADGHWYLTAICYSSGEASGMASHISRGGYGFEGQVRHGLIPNVNKRGMEREHAVLLRKA